MPVASEMNMNDLYFSDSEIESVCEELGIPRTAFNEEGSQRRVIIDCWDNANVIACPGSGKTTVLLAKLLLLSRRMPFADGRGICVLTHTNVAIDEIKSKLGSTADILFKHPNFFGTIQGFVNKFLALPYFLHRSKNSIEGISDDAYNKAIDMRLKFCLKKEKRDTFKKVQHIFRVNESLKYNYRLHVNYKNNITLIDKINGKPLEIKKPRGNTLACNYVDYEDHEKENVIAYLKKLKIEVMKSGILHYDDLFFLANRNLKTNEVASILSKRYKYLFVDEMQDTQQHQMSIIASAFNGSVTKQYFGDPDQAIFSGISGGEMAWDYNQDSALTLNISDSKRYSLSISQCINPFKMKLNDVVGKASWQSNKPCILLYDEPKEALDMFIKEIGNKGLRQTDSYLNWNRESMPFNAVGVVGKKADGGKEKLTIHSYTDNFSKATTNKKINFNNLVSYFQKRPKEETQQEGTRVYYSLFINALIELLKLIDKHVTKASLFKDLSIEDQLIMDEFQQLIFPWIKDIETDKKTPVDIKNEFIEYFKEKDLDFSGYTFVQDNTVLPQNEFKSNSNFFSKDGIDIKIGTIHSVKGETHMATLLFENQIHSKSEADYFYGKASGNLFCGDKYERQKKSFKRIEERLKTAYVAMSRPTHLLCVAMSKERVGCMKCPKEIKEKCNWEIISS